MKPIARFVLRPGGKKMDIKTPDLIIGVPFQKQNILVANRIYQIEEILDELVIKNVGPSAIGRAKESLLHENWYHDINSLLDTCGKYLFATQEEFRDAVKKGQV
jgi:hypothetical protein